MTAPKTDKMYAYYEQQSILPTFARFTTIEQLDRYDRQRAHIFCDKLHLPVQIFKGTHTVEFGPDSGENSLVFARWGANLTLVEPNPNARPQILAYFEKFNLKDKLESLVEVDVAQFESQEKYDLIVAEGFIYTVRPESTWIELFSRLLNENGFCVINYYESTASFLELILKVIHARTKALTGLDSQENGWRLFQSKWNSIPHTRAFESWVMDVLNNPFVRYEYFLNASDLCCKLSSAGFSLYSSWPNYSDTLSIYWHKKELSSEEQLANNLDFIARSSLSFAFGKKLFLFAQSPDEVKAVSDVVNRIVTSIDRLIDDFDASVVQQVREDLQQIKKLLSDGDVLADSEAEKQEAIQLIASIDRIFELLAAGDVKGLTDFCNSDAIFIKNWGVQYHFAVFKKKQVSI